MLWVYDHYKYFHSYSAGIDFSRQNLTSTSGVFRNKLGGCSDFQETIQQQGPIGGMHPQNLEKINIR